MRRGDLLTFGILMDASHESLREDYGVSSPELDRMVELAREGGAAGARLTGAGFGGCMVALADGGHLGGVLEALEEGYFRTRRLSGPLSSVLILAEPAGGASVETL
jgi:galactokinase